MRWTCWIWTRTALALDPVGAGVTKLPTAPPAEAAGVTKYKMRRRAAELKLDAAQQNLTRIDDIVYSQLREALGDAVFEDHNLLRERVAAAARATAVA